VVHGTRAPPISEVLSENALYAPIVGSGRLDGQLQPQIPLPRMSTSQLGSCALVEIKPNLDWPDLQQYMNLIRNYNDRLLTYPEDIIAGFSGVLATLSGVFISGFISGLPEMFFDIALLWQPASPLERRLSSSEASGMSLPSWSWAGWRGDKDQRSWVRGYFRMGSYTAFLHKTRPICQWSCGDGTTWRKLDIAHYKHLNDRSQYIIKSKELPHGWSMSLHDNDKSSFSHSSIPVGQFYYPVVVGGARSQKTNDSSHLLSCRTRRLWLRLGYKLESTHLCLSRWLPTSDGEPCGTILMNMSPTHYRRADDRAIGTACELIAISEGSTPAPIYSGFVQNYKATEKPKSEMKEFYNVLWIEWVDGIVSHGQ
jgi:hypothetical protein